MSIVPVYNKAEKRWVLMTQIRYSHVSIGPAGRAGEQVRLGSDTSSPFDTSSHHKEGNAVPVKFKRKAMKLDAFSMDEIDVRIPDEASAIRDRVSARLDEPIEVIQFRETGSRNQKPDIQVPLFIYVWLSGFPIAEEGIFKLAGSLQTQRKACIQTECLI